MSKTKTNQEQWLDCWGERIHRSGLAVVALLLLELGQSLGFLASQALLLAQPVLAILVDETSINRYIAFLENPSALDGLIQRVEQKADGNG